MKNIRGKNNINMTWLVRGVPAYNEMSVVLYGPGEKEWPLEINSGNYDEGTEPARQFVVDDGSELDALLSYINGASSNYFYIFCCSGTSQWSSDVQNAMKNKFGMTFPASMMNDNHTWAAIGYSEWKNPMTEDTYGAGIFATGENVANASCTCDADGTINLKFPLMEIVGLVGKTFDVEMKSVVQPLNHPIHDTLRGSVRCSQVDVTGSVGSLATGSFKFEGIGALE